MRFWPASKPTGPNVKTPRDNLWRRIEALNLDMIKFKLMDPEQGKGWTQPKADRMATIYKRFLYLTEKYSDKSIIPTAELDEVWHAHILDTRKYAEDCEKTFGHFVHHFPYLGMRGPEDAKRAAESFAETSRLFLEEFGEPLANETWAEAGRCDTG